MRHNTTPAVGDRIFVTDGPYRGARGIVRGTMPHTDELIWIHIDHGPVRSVPVLHLMPEGSCPRHAARQENPMKPERYLRRAAPIAAVRWDGTAMGASQIIDWVIDGGGTATYYCSALRVCLGREDDSHTIRLTDPDVVTHAHPGWYIHQDPDDGTFHASPPADFESSHLPLAPPVDTGTSLFPSLDIPRPHHHGDNR